MCLAVPGRVLETDGKMGRVEFQGNVQEVYLGMVQAKTGDYVLIHAGFAIELIKPAEAEELRNLYRELESAF